MKGHTNHSLSSSPFMVQGLYFKIWKNLLTGPHLRSPVSSVLVRTLSPEGSLLGMGWFCSQTLNQISQNLGCAWLLLQQNRKGLSNLEMKTEGGTIFSVGRGKSQRSRQGREDGIYVCPFPAYGTFTSHRLDRSRRGKCLMNKRTNGLKGSKISHPGYRIRQTKKQSY